MDVKEARTAKVELQEAIAALLAEFVERTGARVTDLDIDRACRYGKVPRYVVDVEVQL